MTAYGLQTSGQHEDKMNATQAGLNIKHILTQQNEEQEEDINQNCDIRVVRLGDKVGIKVTAYPMANCELFRFSQRMIDKIKKETGCTWNETITYSEKDNPEIAFHLLIFYNPDVSIEYEKTAAIALAEINQRSNSSNNNNNNNNKMLT
jgi:hypothetical protein